MELPNDIADEATPATPPPPPILIPDDWFLIGYLYLYNPVGACILPGIPTWFVKLLFYQNGV